MLEKHLSKITTQFTTEHCHNLCILITLFFCWTLAILCPTTYISNNSVTWTSFDQLCMLALTTLSDLSPNNNGHLLFLILTTYSSASFYFLQKKLLTSMNWTLLLSQWKLLYDLHMVNKIVSSATCILPFASKVPFK